MIRYFIPADGDDPAHPNVFHLPSGLVGSGEVRCGDVKKHFPLPGRYHFRFKKAFRDAYVWVDMTDDETVVRSCEGVFTAKVTRLSDGREGDSQAPPPPQQPRQTKMPPSVSASIRRGSGGGGVGEGGDDLLNMGHGSGGGGGTAAIPGPGLMGQPDDLLGMGVFDSAPAGGNVSTARTMPPHSPPMHPTPMSHMTGGVGGVGVSGFGGGSMGTQWQQQHQQQQQQQQFARFPPPGRRGL